jgi:ureidoacrylate peracid hydrolase
MVTFHVEPSKTALMIIDMQNVFVEDSPFAAPDGLAVLDRLNRLAGVCRDAGIGVIHTAHVVRLDHSNMGILGAILPPVQAGVIDDGSVSGDLHAGVQRREGDIFLKKSRYGAFHGTDLEPILRHRGIDTLIIGGIATNVCCETTAREAAVRDLKVLFLSDGTATFGLPDVGYGAVIAQDLQRVTCAVMGVFFGQVLTVNQAIERIRTAVGGVGISPAVGTTPTAVLSAVASPRRHRRDAGTMRDP